MDGLGFGAPRGGMPGAFCDGAHIVQYQGKKFAGTAMRLRPCRGDRARYAVMAHALMLIDPPGPEAIDAINRFLSELGEEREIDIASHTGLPAGMARSDYLERLARAFADDPDLAEAQLKNPAQAARP